MEFKRRVVFLYEIETKRKSQLGENECSVVHNSALFRREKVLAVLGWGLLTLSLAGLDYGRCHDQTAFGDVLIP